MKKLIAASLFTLVLSSNVHAKVNMKYVKLIQCLMSRGGEVTECLNYLDDETARHAGIVRQTSQGSGNNRDQCKSDAIAKAERGALYRCEKETGKQCALSGQTIYNNDLQDNPSVTIGGLSGNKKLCTATAYAKSN
jgi:hypothetical protein